MPNIPTASVYAATKASVRHWRRMIVWVVTTQDMHAPDSYTTMVDALGEGYSGAHCALCKLCKAAAVCGPCPLRPMCPNPESPWHDLVRARTWCEWLTAAVQVLRDLQKAQEATKLILQIEVGKHTKKQRRKHARN